MDFTKEQIAVLKTLADSLIAEAAEIETRNKEVNAHTKKLEDFNTKVAKLAEKHGVDTSVFIVQTQPHEHTPETAALDKLTKEAAVLAKEAGLDDFIVKPTSI